MRNFLVANALYWLDHYHVDGLRVDAVASMLYLDYSRKAGEWVPNRYGGRENLDAIDFLRQLNDAVRPYYPGAMTFAEESTAFPGVTQPAHLGGLGFHFKWNMGWMNDTLRYAALDPIYRRHHHSLITFSFVYAWSEKFVLPISHDEVVHGKGVAARQDAGRRMAEARQLPAGSRAYMTAHPGKKLLFMGCEFGQWQRVAGRAFARLAPAPGPEASRAAGSQSRAEPALSRACRSCTRSDADPEGFAWIDLHNADQSVFAFLRRDPRDPGSSPIVCVFNGTPVPRDDYWIGVPSGGGYAQILDTDELRFGGGSTTGSRTLSRSRNRATASRSACA